LPPKFFGGAGGQILKVSTLAVAALALVLLMTGVTLGWTLAGQSGWTLAGNGELPEQTRPSRLEASPPALELSMPEKDVPGGNVSGLPRYPGSVRIHYRREDLDNVVWTEVRYVTSADVDAVRGFYRDVFRTEGWSVGDISFSEARWNFFVIEGEREVYIELEPRGEIVEVDFVLTEPKLDKELKPEQIDEPEKRSAKLNTQEPAPQQQAPAPQPAPSRPPAQPPPSPVYDHDDDYDESYNDLEGGED
jgi:hypothetical protein